VGCWWIIAPTQVNIVHVGAIYHDCPDLPQELEKR
jgi:hypothetical protein